MKRDKKSYHILVVEDNAGDFTIVEDLLSEQIESPDIVQASTFKEASEILREASKPFDVILLDLSLPDKSGQELITEMLRLAFFCPVVILTGYTDIDFSIKSISQGVLDYLLKDDLNAVTLHKSIIYAIERKKSIKELKESERRYINLFHLSPQPMWVFDVETFRFVQVNKAAIESYGYSEKEFLEMTMLDIRMGEDVTRLKEGLKPGNLDESIFNRKVRHRKKSGEIIEVEIYSTPITINDKIFRSVIGIDVTEKNLQEHRIIKAIIKTQEDERYEIGSELHDNVCQILAVSQMTLAMLKDSLPETAMTFYEQCRKNIALTLKEIRDLSHRLAPAFFDDSTLEEAFTRLFDSFNPEEKIEYFLHFDRSVMDYPISLEIQLNLYRILQEQLRNILNYAHASAVDVFVSIDHDELELKISDNGVGYNTQLVSKGIGLANMKRRAELFSGNFEIFSSPGNGCDVIVRIPLPVLVYQAI